MEDIPCLIWGPWQGVWVCLWARQKSPEAFEKGRSMIWLTFWVDFILAFWPHIFFFFSNGAPSGTNYPPNTLSGDIYHHHKNTLWVKRFTLCRTPPHTSSCSTLWAVCVAPVSLVTGYFKRGSWACPSWSEKSFSTRLWRQPISGGIFWKLAHLFIAKPRVPVQNHTWATPNFPLKPFTGCPLTPRYFLSGPFIVTASFFIQGSWRFYSMSMSFRDSFNGF